MNISDKELKALVSRLVEKKLVSLKENTNFMATRRLATMARETALDFEKNIITQLKLIDPDQASPEAQELYFNAMKSMEAKVVAAVVDTVRELEHLPRMKPEGQ